MQALTGLWATQFGTLNWAAHGGFCSVNMAAAGLMTLGYSFWEFGEPDWEHARLFVLWGVAEDHASNPIKIGPQKTKRARRKIIAVNPVRTGYQAIADEWIAITPARTAYWLCQSRSQPCLLSGALMRSFWFAIPTCRILSIMTVCLCAMIKGKR